MKPGSIGIYKTNTAKILDIVFLTVCDIKTQAQMVVLIIYIRRLTREQH